MTTMKKTLALVMLLYITLGAQAQLLWKVSGNGLDHPSYVMGTHHLAPLSIKDSIRTSWVPTIWLPSASRTALQA